MPTEINDKGMIFELNKKILSSLYQVYVNDEYLIEFEPDEDMDDHNDTKHHVGERAVVFRFAHYLQNEINADNGIEGYSVDCEFNRNTKDLKKLPLPHKTNNKEGSDLVIPDVVVHYRGTNDYNLLVMEFKTYWNTDQSHDEDKIIGFTSQNDVYKYKYGVTVLLEPYCAMIQGYENKNKTHEIQMKKECGKWSVTDELDDSDALIAFFSKYEERMSEMNW